MSSSKYFRLIDKMDGRYLVFNGPPPDTTTLIAELQKMDIQIDPFVLSQKLQFIVNGEVLLIPKEDLPVEDPVSIEISADKMTATMIVNANSDFPVSITYLQDQLAILGVVYGTNKEALSKTLNHKGKQYEVASGFPAVNGQDSIVVMYYQEPSKTPVLLEDGRVDYYELGQVVSVRGGDIVGLRTPATAGVSGYNVFGEAIPARPGMDKPFPVGKGILVVDDKAIAEYDGALSWEHNKLLIIKMITITGDVDFSVGNIDFPGKVLITGNVTEGFRVQADDDIDVRGGVENAEITSRAGSVFVQRGIIGRGKAIIKAYKNVEAKFIQEATVDAGHNIVVNEYVMRCDIKAGNSVLIQGRKGKIMGNNSIIAKTKIKASQIQNSAGLHLIVEGIQRQQYFDRIRELNDKIASIEKELARMAKDIRQLENKTTDPSTLITLQSLLPEYMQCTDCLETCIVERNLVVNILRNTRGEGMIEIGGGLEMGMRLTIKDESVLVDNSLNQMSMYFDPDKKGLCIYNAKK